MSDLSVRPSLQRGHGGGSSSSIPLWVVFVAVLVMLAMVAAVAYILMQDGTGKATRTYPKQWDSRVAPYAKIAEKQRGLLFGTL